MAHLEFYSRGKLLITGEYFILKGAKSLALPLKKGQKTTIDTLNDKQGNIYWNSYYNNKLWFEAIFKRKNLEVIETNDHKKALFVQNLLQQSALLKQIFNGRFLS